MTFYSHDILHRKGGKFGKIWVAATKVVKLTRREVASVNISQSCEDVLRYLDGGLDRPRGRLSLYLSTFLMYGLIRIHYKQAEYLLADVESIFVRVQRIRRNDKDIDLKDAPRADLVTQKEELGHPDIDYGFYMIMQELDRPEMMLPPMEGWALESQSRSPSGSRSSGRLSRRSGSHARQDRSSAAVLPELPSTPNTVASKSLITMEDPPPQLINTVLSPIQVNKEDELPMPEKEVDITGLEANEPRLAVKDLLPASTPIGARTPDRAPRQRRDRTRRDTQTTLESPSKQAQVEVQEKTPLAAAQPPEIPQTPPRVGPRSPEVTQVIVPSPDKGRKDKRKSRRLLTLDPHIEVETAPPRRRRQKRPLRLIVDPVTQIPKAQIKKNLTTTKDIMQRFQVPDSQGIDSTDWMRLPGRREIRRPPFNQLWSRGAIFRRNLAEADLPALSSPESGRSSEVEGQQPGVNTDGVQIGVDGQQGAGGARVSSEEMFIATRLPPLSELERERLMAEGAAQEQPTTAEDSIQKMRRTSAAGQEGLEISEIEMPSVEIARDHSGSHSLDQGALNISDAPIPMEDTSKRSETSASKRRSRSRKSREDSGELQPTPSKSGTSLQTSSMGLGGLYNIVEDVRRRSRSRKSREDSGELQPTPSKSGTSLQTSSMGLGGLYNIVEDVRRRSRSRKSREDSGELQPTPSKSGTSLQTSSMGLGGLYNIVEEARLELPLPEQDVGPQQQGARGLILEEQELGDSGNREEELLRLLTEELAHQTSSSTTFRKLCPVEQATRKQAARMFTALLGLCAKGTVKTKQKTSYGDIYITMN